MQYVKIALTDEVKDGEKKKVALDDKTLLLTKYQGTYYVIDNKCPHMGGSLYDGKLEGYRITCPRHGSVFDVRTGKVLQNGKLAFIKVRVGDDKAYPVKVEGSGIFVGLE
jgi:3-phenylpropionate/trans-cinnamate dioxygenase ferredoxin subunit